MPNFIEELVEDFLGFGSLMWKYRLELLLALTIGTSGGHLIYHLATMSQAKYHEPMLITDPAGHAACIVDIPRNYVACTRIKD